MGIDREKWIRCVWSMGIYRWVNGLEGVGKWSVLTGSGPLPMGKRAGYDGAMGWIRLVGRLDPIGKGVFTDG